MLELTKCINSFGTIFSMMNIAIYMGFSELYIIGADYTYNPSRQHHFYDYFAFSKVIGKEIIFKMINDYSIYSGMDCNEVTEDELFYYPNFVKHGFDNNKHIKFNEFAKSKNVKIFNVVPDSYKSDIYKQIKFSDI